MKFFIATFFVCIAMAAAELKWAEDGQYRLVDTEDVPIKYKVLAPEDEKLKIIAPEDLKYKVLAPEDLKYKVLAPEDLKYRVLQAPLPLDYTYWPYRSFYPYRGLPYKPFRYSYTQLTN